MDCHRLMQQKGKEKTTMTMSSFACFSSKLSRDSEILPICYQGIQTQFNMLQLACNSCQCKLQASKASTISCLLQNLRLFTKVQGDIKGLPASTRSAVSVSISLAFTSPKIQRLTILLLYMATHCCWDSIRPLLKEARNPQRCILMQYQKKVAVKKCYFTSS